MGNLVQEGREMKPLPNGKAMTNQEINEAVARKLDLNPHFFGLGPNGQASNMITRSNGFSEALPDYSTSIEAAWEIVEHLRKLPTAVSQYAFEIHAAPNGYFAYITGPTWKQVVKGETDTAALAICLAFLKLP